MRSKSSSKSAFSALLVSVLFAAPVFAAEAVPAPSPSPSSERPCGEGGRWGHGGKHGRKGMGQRFERAVEQGRLSRAQADQFKAEAQQLRAEKQALRQSSGGKLTPEQKAQFKQRQHALREKVRAAMVPAAGQGA